MTQAPSPGRDLPPGGYDALVLTGGGIHAAAFHFAALACLEDWVPGFDAGALPVYLGSSAGATVAALVGGGLPVRRIHRGIVEGDDYFPVRREHFFPGSRTAFLRPLLAHADVAECAVVGLPDEARGQLVTAFVVLRAGVVGDAVKTKELQEFVKQRIAPYKYPRRVAYVAELPKTATGKLQRFRLREQDSSVTAEVS